MTESQEEILAAFADGEPVAAPTLAEALADPDGRAYMIDVLVLRGLIDGRAAARSEFADPVPVATRWRWLTAAAVLATVCVFGGYSLGVRRTSQPADAVRPIVNPAVASASAPAPTRVIRFERGVDWTERVGGG